MPKITVGLMVYNEEKYLRETLNSILEQGLEDIEIVIGDNASSDKSSDIITDYAAKDPRIVHIKREKNIGALQNWNSIVKHAKGEYFVLAGGHDKWSKNYLSKLSELLDTNSDAVLAFAKTQWIDEDNNELNKETSLLDTSGMTTLGKFISLMFSNQHYLYGMIRTNAMQQTRLQLQFIGSGEVFLQELAVFGSFVLVENERWYRRINRSLESNNQRLYRYYKILFSSRFYSFRFLFLPYFQFMLIYLALPFHLKNLTLKKRLNILAAYPIVLFKIILSLVPDIKWGIYALHRVLFEKKDDV